MLPLQPLPSLPPFTLFFSSTLAATLLFQSVSLCVFNFFGLAVIKSCQTTRCGSASVGLELVLMESTEAAASLSLQNNSALLLRRRGLSPIPLSEESSSSHPICETAAKGASKIITPFRCVPLDNFSVIAMYSFIFF